MPVTTLSVAAHLRVLTLVLCLCIGGLQGQDHKADHEALRAHLESVINEGGGGLVVTSMHHVMRYGYNHSIRELDLHGVGESWGYPPRQMWDDEPVDYLPNKTIIVTCEGENFDGEGWDNHFKKVKDAEGGCCLLM